MSLDRSQQGLITWMVGCCQDEGVRHAGNNLFPFQAHMFRKARAAAARHGSTPGAAEPGARLCPCPVPGDDKVPRSVPI